MFAYNTLRRLYSITWLKPSLGLRIHVHSTKLINNIFHVRWNTNTNG